MVTPASEEKVDEILAGWEQPDSGHVCSYPVKTGTPGVRCAEFAAYVRALRAALSSAHAEIERLKARRAVLCECVGLGFECGMAGEPDAECDTCMGTGAVLESQ